MDLVYLPLGEGNWSVGSGDGTGMDGSGQEREDAEEEQFEEIGIELEDRYGPEFEVTDEDDNDDVEEELEVYGLLE